MKEINISKNITDLRKRKGITQEQLAVSLNVSPQAVSKWETNTSQPDIQTLPLIADFFGVSIDYLYYGADLTYDEIYDKVFMKTCNHEQMSKESFEDAHKLFYFAHNGISKGIFLEKGNCMMIPFIFQVKMVCRYLRAKVTVQLLHESFSNQLTKQRQTLLQVFFLFYP